MQIGIQVPAHLHRIEVFDSVISDKSSLYSATLYDIEKFQYILEQVKVYAMASNEMPLFYDDESRTSDPGNRCKLRLRYALLMGPCSQKRQSRAGLTTGTLRYGSEQHVQYSD